MLKLIKTEVYSRVSGFYRPVSSYNKGKKEEFADRKYLSLEKIKNKIEEKREEIV